MDADANNKAKVTALTVSGLALTTFAVAAMTEPLSGPFCTAGVNCFVVPCAPKIKDRYPRDYYWMYMAMVLFTIWLFLQAQCLEYALLTKRGVASAISGLVFAVLACSALVCTYFIQVSVIQASLLHGEHEGVDILSQYNPHGVFIAMEEIGYMFASLSLAFQSNVFAQSKTWRSRFIRLMGMGGLVATVATFSAISYNFGHLQREYRFEVAVISIVYIILAVNSSLIAFEFAPCEIRFPEKIE